MFLDDLHRCHPRGANLFASDDDLRPVNFRNPHLILDNRVTWCNVQLQTYVTPPRFLGAKVSARSHIVVIPVSYQKELPRACRRICGVQAQYERGSQLKSPIPPK
jgi:hypothetical protein